MGCPHSGFLWEKSDMGISPICPRSKLGEKLRKDKRVQQAANNSLMAISDSSDPLSGTAACGNYPLVGEHLGIAEPIPEDMSIIGDNNCQNPESEDNVEVSKRERERKNQ